MSDELEVMRGEPVKVTLCGKEMIVTKLPITKKLDLIEMWGELGEQPDQSLKTSVPFMMKVISFMLGVSVEQLDTDSDLKEIAEAFGILYKRELLPLLKGVERFREVLTVKE